MATCTDIEKLIVKFEDCTLSPKEFSHSAHLQVAFWYVYHLPITEAMNKTRTGIQKFANSVGAHGLYNETITRFWVQQVADYLVLKFDNEQRDLSIQAMLDEFTNSKILLNFYSRETLHSETAKQSYVEPDL